MADCIAAYLAHLELVFHKSRYRVTAKGKIKGHVDSEEQAQSVREVITKQGLPENALLKDESDTMSKVCLERLIVAASCAR